MTSWNVPGLAIAIVQNDRVVYLKAAGVKELGKPDPITPDTLFEIGSTSKAFTSTSLAMLVDQKKLSWDDPVHNYVPYFHLSDPCADAMVTIRDIASHHTGLGTHDELWDFTLWPREQVLRSVATLKLTRPFRSAYIYSNIQFTLAGEVVAAASGMPWEDFVRTRIFEPLGMTHTRTSLPDWNASSHALGYRWDTATQSAVPQHFNDYTNIAPAGAVKSCARDMAQWLRFQLADGQIDGKRLVSADALDETHTPQVALHVPKETNPETNLMAYGLGWTVQDYRGQLLVSHAGALNGFRTQVALLPNQNAGVVILENIGRGYAILALRDEILDAILGGPTRDWNQLFLDLDKKADAAAEAAKSERDAKLRLDTPASHDLAAYAGTYSDPAYGTATISNDANGLTLHYYRLTIPLTHLNYDTFEAFLPEEDLDEIVQFELGTDGAVRSMKLFGQEFQKDEGGRMKDESKSG